MRSEKDQMTVGKEKNVVEIKFRDIQREQENTPGNPKQKEEKKEVFTKVGRRGFVVLFTLRGKQTWRRLGGRWDRFSTADSDRSRTRCWNHDDPTAPPDPQLDLQPPISLDFTLLSDFVDVTIVFLCKRS